MTTKSNPTYWLKEGQAHVYTHDAENRLIEVKQNGALLMSFVYDGDGGRVKSTLVGSPSNTVTYYIGNHSEYEIVGQTTTLRRYFYAGSTRVAMRVVDGATNPTYWLLNDHLGSTAITADASGALSAELRFKAWGEQRYASGSTPTTYRYTGQREQSQLSIYFYGARWYDPDLSRFLSPDTIIPGAGNSQAWDRFAYALNSPVRFVDPTGHAAGTPTFNFDADFTGSLLFGIRFKNGTKNWDLKGMLSVMEGVRSVARRYSEITHGRASDAFRAVHNTSTTNPLVMEMGCPKCTKMALTVNSHHVQIAKFYPDWRDDKNFRDRNFITHELGHVFNAQMVNDLSGVSSPYQVLNRRQSTDRTFPDRIETPGLNYGFASPSGTFTWQQSTDPHYSEEFADQYLGWTYNTWEISSDGFARASFMNANMQLWVSMTGYP